ncbi:MAG TPA: hypothetical protein VMF30_02425, partial [Pirellulales bacterium]|nr:hypothetical protein [Pirellulales bacterium]
MLLAQMTYGLVWLPLLLSMVAIGLGIAAVSIGISVVRSRSPIAKAAGKVAAGVGAVVPLLAFLVTPHEWDLLAYSVFAIPVPVGLAAIGLARLPAGR